MSDRYRIGNADKGIGRHARLTRPILVLITVLIQSAITPRVSRDDKLRDKPRLYIYFFPLSLSFAFGFLFR